METIRLYLSCVLVLLAASGCGKRERKQEAKAAAPAPVEVRVARAESRRIDRAISVTGSLVADETVNLGAEVAGTVARVHADFGQSVRQGQVLAEIDRRELSLQLERARAALAQALARVGLNPSQADASPESSPAIRQATAQLEDAHFKYESAARLVKTGDISQERFNELEKSYRARQAALEATRDELRTLLAAVQGLRADVKLAEKRLADATVRAPFDGAVVARLVSAGQYLKENTPIFTLVKARPLRLRVEIPEPAVGEIRTGTSLTFTTDAAPGREFHAMVRELNPALDPRSRSLAAEGRLVEPDGVLRPGMFVQVRLVVARQAEVVVVPKDSLYSMAGLTKIFVIRGGEAAEYHIAPGQEIDGWVDVTGAGVHAGEQVAIDHLSMLVRGVKVIVKGARLPRATQAGEAS